MWRRTRTAAADVAIAPPPRTLRAARAIVLVATALFLLVVCRWRPWDLFDRAGFSNDFYDEQARSFLHLRLSVDPAVPGPEGFLIDGKTYLYYGPFLALARLPFALFGHVFTGRLVRLSMVAAFASLLTATFHLAELARSWAARTYPHRLRLPGADAWWRTPCVVAAVACSPALFLAGWVSVYHETELWACTFAIWAAVGALRCIDEPRRAHVVLAVAAASAATLTRAPVGFGATVGIGVVALLLWRRDRRTSTMLVGGASIGVVGHFAVNVAKFGSLFGLPGDKQLLSIQNPARAAWFAGNHGSFFGTRFLKTTIAQYLRPDTIRFERLLPFVRFGPPAPQYGSYPLESTTPSASLTASATLVFLAGLVGVVILLRRRAWPWLGVVAGGCIAAAPSFLIGFIGDRYLVDMLPALIVPAAIACWVVRMPAHWRNRRIAQAALGALVVWGVWCNVALATWVQNLKEPGFTALRYEIDGAIFGDPAPGIELFDPQASVPRDGIVAVDTDDAGACRAVYIAEQGAWVALERAEDVRALSGHLTDAALVSGTPTLIAGGDDWSIAVTRGADGAAAFSYEHGGTEVATGTARVDAGSEIQVVSDPITHELAVTVDGHQALFSFDVPASPMVRGEGLGPATDAHETLCRQLLARR